MKVTIAKPTLVFLAGIAATGKTTLGEAVTRHISDSFYIDKDTINRSFLRLNDLAHKGSMAMYGLHGQTFQITDDFYHSNVRFQTYDCMLNMAKDNMALGKVPIIHALYTKELENGYLDKVVSGFFSDMSPKIKILYCHADESIVRNRVVQRGAIRDAEKMTPELWTPWLVKNPIVNPSIGKYDHKKIDTGQPLDVCLKLALEYIQL